VNLGALDLADPALVERVRGILGSAGLDPHRLTVEVTETVVMADLDETALQLEALERLGVRIALDDFGTGYSSLSYLQRLPISVLKVDRSLVSGGRRRERSILRSVADLGQSLAMQVVLEGIESPREVELARDLGCGFGQGHHLGRPLDAGKTWKAISERGASLPALPVVTDLGVKERAEQNGGAPRARRDDSPLILVVDDHLSTLELFGALLEASGYRALLALTGPEALRKAHQHTPQLVITDLHMPGMDGAELASAMKADPALRSVPVVMCTRFDADQIAEPAELGSFDDELAKPPDPTAEWLGSQVKVLLEKHGRRG
jgi:CheY-like chemotaxis protein